MSGKCAVCGGTGKCVSCKGEKLKALNCKVCDGDGRCPRCHGKGTDPVDD